MIIFLKHRLIFFLVFMGIALLFSVSNCKTEEAEVPEKKYVVDIDGNQYEMVQIGQQTWMAENLRVTRFRDGKELLNPAQDIEWGGTGGPAYCNYNRDEKLAKVYGRLYNGAALYRGELCPEGWHVPSTAEWTELIDHLGGADLAGGKLKEKGTVHWQSPNIGASNESGFNALPGGYRFYEGNFEDLGLSAFWWADPEGSTVSAGVVRLTYDSAKVNRYQWVQNLGMSVRCVKDE